MKILTGLISSLTLLSLNVVGLSQVQANFRFWIADFKLNSKLANHLRAKSNG
ncbi:hypothetical protein GXM_03867 [Nostoc sphaeroides CCNUC1]|uniref:Uncharacterized protein n=1 Tax=Nostoc sphaeroides CCNUC1 TaxID=2653204 RepID=A0A5P8W2A2_9NOSO|nr:hypothetical protein GXM_03867 [Nostoc sphaeroides CCNUC1]